ncbi:transcriptional regulator [Polaromonas sp. P1-6]|nr:transcriptional regulator [Polaromonas sp. P1-6]
MREVSGLIDLNPLPATPEGDHLDILATLVQAYEAKHYPIAPPAPIEAMKFRMDQEGLTVKDLESIIGPSHRVYEVLNRTRPLTLHMIRRLHRLHRRRHIPAEVLIHQGEEVAIA